jgi:hypothetical protein
LRPLLFLPAVHHQFPRLHDGTDILAFGPCEPHESLSEEVIGAVLIVRAVDLTEILGSVVGVVELEDFLRRDDVVEVAEDEEDGQVAV